MSKEVCMINVLFCLQKTMNIENLKLKFKKITNTSLIFDVLNELLMMSQTWC